MTKNNIIQDLFLHKYNQYKNSKILQINKEKSIVEKYFLRIGGIDQWVSIRGEDRDNPILLFIHGGPGSVYSIFSPLLREWEKHFTIVQWDQRGAGKTFKKNGKSGSGIISFEQLVKDGIELSEYLCCKYNHKKIILIGSSVGSLIGVMMAKERPNLFYAYVGTDQNVPDTEAISYKLILDAFNSIGHKKGAQLIKNMGPDKSKWKRNDFEKINQYNVKAIKDVPNMIMDIMLPSMLSSPEHKLSDLMYIFKGMNFTLDCMYDELVNFEMQRLGLEFELPFFIFQGDSDIITPTVLAERYLDKLTAPHKEFVYIKNAGHLACFARKEQFLDELVKRVKPFVVI